MRSGRAPRHTDFSEGRATSCAVFPFVFTGTWRVMVRVSKVIPGSICDEMGVVPGTELLTVNGRTLADFLDWEFLTADDELVIDARLPAGEDIVSEVAHPEGARLSSAPHPPRIRRCANRCQLCLIQGLPSGLRKPLYVRDVDYRP